MGKKGWKKQLYTINDLQEIARENGGKCISTEFKKVKDKYKWECDWGHIWEASFSNILYGNTWCPECRGKKIGTIEEMRLLAKAKGGRCLSSEYKNKNTKLLWECEEGHRWWATPDSIKNNDTWCAICSGVPRYTIVDMQEIARSKGGGCLSEQYTNYSDTMTWKCERGHIWNTPAKYILKGHWCHECSNHLPKDLNHLKEIAESRDGKLLSNEYKGMGANYEWQCENGHRWFAPAGAVKAGRWCHQCRKWTIEEFQKIAEARGGKCLSTEYIDCFTPLDFICKEGHVFKGIPTNVKKKGAWCTYCNTYIWEEKTRLVFETLLGKPFIKTRAVLGDYLELDGYNDDDPNRKIAFEYQGEQHYYFNQHFHNDADGFLHQILSDLEKKYRCKDLEIELIIVPYTANDNLVEFITEQLTIRNIKFNNVEIDLNKVYRLKSKLEVFQDIAQSYNGKLLSTYYKDHKTKLEFECEHGHLFKLRPYEVRRLGRWCKECNKEPLRKKQLEKILNIVEKRGGKCHSKEYINNSSVFDLECHLGHRWKTPAAVILKEKHWCPECAKNKRRKSVI